MSVLVRSLSNVAQTLDGVALPAWARQTRSASTAALVAAQTARTIQMDEVSSGASDAQLATTIAAYVPVTSATINLPDDVELVVIDPGATIAALTLNLPVAPYEGQRVEVYFDNVVTALTMAVGTGSGHALKAALTAATAAGFASWRFSKADVTWYRVG
jgi:hypothetical protein